MTTFLIFLFLIVIVYIIKFNSRDRSQDYINPITRELLNRDNNHNKKLFFEDLSAMLNKNIYEIGSEYGSPELIKTFLVSNKQTSINNAQNYANTYNLSVNTVLNIIDTTYRSYIIEINKRL